MSIQNLQIEDSLKTRLSLLLNEFESYRISNMDIISTEPDLTSSQKVEIKQKKRSFFKKFFFSDF